MDDDRTHGSQSGGMAYDLQARFRKLRVATSTPFSQSTQESTAGCDNGCDVSTWQLSNDDWSSDFPPDLAGSYPKLSLPAGTVTKSTACPKDGGHTFTPPINVPSHRIDGSASRGYDTDLLHENRYHGLSSLGDYLQNRRKSITFNDKVTFDTGHQQALEERISKLEINTRSKGHSLLQELARRPGRLSSERSQSEADCTNHDHNAGAFLKTNPRHIDDKQEIRGNQKAAWYTTSITAVDDLAINSKSNASEPGSSLTSRSTSSPIIEEIHTPSDSAMECLLSPVQLYSSFYHSTSLEESSIWPKSRRQSSSSRPKSFNGDRRGSLRQNRRSVSRRSNSSSLSPATAFLSKWSREEAPSMPDDEGQEVGEYVLGKEIGFGGFSVVREAFTLKGEERIRHAVKIVRRHVSGKEEMENERLQSEFEHEVGLWRCLSHHNILPLVAVHITDFATFCFTQLNSGGTLFDLVRSNRQGLQKDLARRYTYQLASAIRYLHEDVRVVHRDLKLENCLIDLSHPNSYAEGGNLLLCDFGLAEFVRSDTRSNSPDPYDHSIQRASCRDLEQSDTCNSIAGSLQYASPELILSPAGLLNPAVDMWAFGVVVYSLLVGTLPFQHMFQPRVQTMILAGDWNQAALNEMGEEVEELVKGCLTMDWEERWEIGKVLDGTWLNGCKEMMEEISGSGGGWR